MLSERKLKVFKSLQIKKYRQQERMFMVEGAKGVEESLKSTFKVLHLLLTETFKNQLEESNIQLQGEVEIVSEKELKSVGIFSSNNAGLAVLEMPEQNILNFSEGVILVLDNVRDPGNLGTIIRIADWYGVCQIICSKETADLYNPKVINTTMGSFTRVNISYQDLDTFFSKNKMPVYGALLSGESIYQKELLQNAVVLMGNESKGISPQMESYVDHPIRIPGRGGAESLNVAIATAVVLDNFFR